MSICRILTANIKIDLSALLVFLKLFHLLAERNVFLAFPVMKYTTIFETVIITILGKIAVFSLEAKIQTQLVVQYRG